MGWLDKLTGKRPEFAHDAPDLEGTMPAMVADRHLVTWSAAGDRFWDTLGGARVRAAAGPALAVAGLSPDAVVMAVAGRADPRDPPYIVWAMRFGDTRASALPGPATALAMEAMSVDPSRGEDWADATIADKAALVGNEQMIHQDRHHRGKPYVYLGAWALYALITEDEAWAAEVIRQLPAS